MKSLIGLLCVNFAWASNYNTNFITRNDFYTTEDKDNLNLYLSPKYLANKKRNEISLTGSHRLGEIFKVTQQETKNMLKKKMFPIWPKNIWLIKKHTLILEKNLKNESWKP